MKLYLENLELKTFTLQNAEDYCLINNIKPDKILILDLSGNKLTDISGIKLFKNLKIVYLGDNQITDISVLKDLNSLKNLNISWNEIYDISVISNLINIERLNLSNNKLTDISALNNLENLQTLNIANNNISILNLKKSINLQSLNLGNTEITDLSAVLKNLINLEYLDIRDLELKSDQVQYIKSLKKLKELFCRNGFKDMANINKLRHIFIYKY